MKRTRVALVIPYIEQDVNAIVRELSGWTNVGAVCRKVHQQRLGIFLYSHKGKVDGQPPRLETLLRASDAFSSSVLPCFSELQTFYADLTPEEDNYPEGPSVMFFRLFLQQEFAETALAGYTHAQWMEWDVKPVKPHWMDAVLAESEEDDFWVRGSHFYGPGLDGAVMYKENANWVGHINGNALYKLHDAEFYQFMRLVVEREPPTDYWRPFDIAMWKVLMDQPYAWRMYQYYRPKFQYAKFITHIGFHHGVDAMLRLPDSYLVHGNKNSAGNGMYFKKFTDGKPTAATSTIYGDEIRPDVQLSVLCRTFARDMPFAAVALQSAKTHIPHALEYVAVVSEEDFALANRTLPRFVSIRTEPKLLPDGAVQQKYTKLMADMYTRGRFVFHLDSDVVLYRQLLHKDVFVLGKPILQYDSYANLVGTSVSQWKKGIEYAMGEPVEYEFSRSNDHVYPRHVYIAARQYLEKRFNMPLLDFLKTRQGVLLPSMIDTEVLFSDFNYLGAFLHSQMPDVMAFNYVGVKKDGLAHDPITQVVKPPSTCQGNARWVDPAVPGSQPEKLKAQIQLLKDVATGKVPHCYPLINFLKTIELV